MKVNFVFFLFCIYLFIPTQVQAQMAAVSGYVKNQTNGKMKGNVTVYESVSGVGTITNSEGYYRLLLIPGQQRLEFSNTGFNTYTSAFTLVGDTIISVELIPVNYSLEKTDGSDNMLLESYVASNKIKEE